MQKWEMEYSSMFFEYKLISEIIWGIIMRVSGYMEYSPDS